MRTIKDTSRTVAYGFRIIVARDEEYMTVVTLDHSTIPVDTISRVTGTPREKN
jgi:hypothetical protein